MDVTPRVVPLEYVRPAKALTILPRVGTTPKSNLVNKIIPITRLTGSEHFLPQSFDHCFTSLRKQDLPNVPASCNISKRTADKKSINVGGYKCNTLEHYILKEILRHIIILSQKADQINANNKSDVYDEKAALLERAVQLDTILYKQVGNEMDTMALSSLRAIVRRIYERQQRTLDDIYYNIHLKFVNENASPLHLTLRNKDGCDERAPFDPFEKEKNKIHNGEVSITAETAVDRHHPTALVHCGVPAVRAPAMLVQWEDGRVSMIYDTQGLLVEEFYRFAYNRRITAQRSCFSPNRPLSDKWTDNGLLSASFADFSIAFIGQRQLERIENNPRLLESGFRGSQCSEYPEPSMGDSEHSWLKYGLLKAAEMDRIMYASVQRTKEILYEPYHICRPVYPYPYSQKRERKSATPSIEDAELATFLDRLISERVCGLFGYVPTSPTKSIPIEEGDDAFIEEIRIAHLVIRIRQQLRLISKACLALSGVSRCQRIGNGGFEYSRSVSIQNDVGMPPVPTISVTQSKEHKRASALSHFMYATGICHTKPYNSRLIPLMRVLWTIEEQIFYFLKPLLDQCLMKDYGQVHLSPCVRSRVLLLLELCEEHVVNARLYELKAATTRALSIFTGERCRIMVELDCVVQTNAVARSTDLIAAYYRWYYAFPEPSTLLAACHECGIISYQTSLDDTTLNSLHGDGTKPNQTCAFDFPSFKHYFVRPIGDEGDMLPEWTWQYLLHWSLGSNNEGWKNLSTKHSPFQHRIEVHTRGAEVLMKCILRAKAFVEKHRRTKTHVEIWNSVYRAGKK